MISPCERIAADMGALYSCEPRNGNVRIRTPFLYPDGDVIDLFLTDDGRYHSLTDFGETIRWLKMQTATKSRSDKQTRMIADVCQTHGIEFFRGELKIRIASKETLADDVQRLGQACVRVSDLWFTFRSRVAEPITDEVAELLTEKQVAFERGKKQAGRSGNVWSMDFHTWTPSTSALVQVLSTGSRGASRRIAEHTLAAWVDLSHLQSDGPTRFVSLFDDTQDVWSEEDFKLLSEISDVQMWSHPTEFLASLGA